MSDFLTFSKLGYFGSIGNQLFQLAALISYAKDNKLEPKIPNHSGYYEDTYGRYVDYVPNGIDTQLEFLTQQDEYQNEITEKTFHYTPIEIQPNSSISGYFQSEKYFTHHSDSIRQTFLRFKPEIQKQINSIVLQLPLNKSLTAIHVRRGDYLNKQEFHPVQDISYYNAAKKEITINDQAYLIFSDDMEWCQENFDDSHYFINSGNPFVDLGLMAFCDDFIIANSSFSWWGAWLSVNDKKTIVTPKNWFGYRNSHLSTKDLIPESWIQI